jgi:choline monooxygenase
MEGIYILKRKFAKFSSMYQKFHIHTDIHKAETLPAAFYRDDQVFDLLREKVFLRSWQWIGHESLIARPNNVYPFTLLDNYLTEPMLLTRDEQGEVNCMTNVCTHRGNIVVHHADDVKDLRCLYHGRRFDLQGTFVSMPEFKEAADFPRACDNLHRFPVGKWGPFLFVGLNPVFEFSTLIEKLNERVGFLPLQNFRFEESLSKEYLVNAHWALYVDNYLEGFHIPFVHQDLNAALSYGDYTTELYDHMNLQIGYTNKATDVFDLPQGHPDYGKKVAAYYYWIFPNVMFNFYPWGLSVNVVQPQTMERTKVQFLTYVWDTTKLHSGAGALLDKVEREDEFVVEGVQKGVRSHFYKAGRYSPKREQGVHHFHRLLQASLERD